MSRYVKPLLSNHAKDAYSGRNGSRTHAPFGKAYETLEENHTFFSAEVNIRIELIWYVLQTYA